MASYYIWHPHAVAEEPGALSFILTPGEAGYEISEGTEQFIAEIMRDLGIKANVVNWSIITCRSTYYSEYLGEEDWRDNWQLVWKVKIETDKTPGLIWAVREFPLETEALDESWAERNQFFIEHQDPAHCLVIVDFGTQAAAGKTREAILESARTKSMQGKYSVGIPSFEVFLSNKDAWQMQIDLGRYPGNFYASGADYALLVMDLCHKFGGKTHIGAL